MDLNLPESLRTHLKHVERALKHEFKDPSLLFEALTHSSYCNEQSRGTRKSVEEMQDNERFEFLGDAVIGLVVAERLMLAFSEANEGTLSRWRSVLVSRRSLAEIAGEIGMGQWVLLGKGEKRTGGSEKQSILAGVFEAVIGALYLDAGLEGATRFLSHIYDPRIETLKHRGDAYLEFDQKTYLQEKTQSLFRSVPVYRVIEAWGLEHEKTFRVEIEVDGRVLAVGDGKSKKEAEQRAAEEALEILGV